MIQRPQSVCWLLALVLQVLGLHWAIYTPLDPSAYHINAWGKHLLSPTGTIEGLQRFPYVGFALLGLCTASSILMALLRYKHRKTQLRWNTWALLGVFMRIGTQKLLLWHQLHHINLSVWWQVGGTNLLIQASTLCCLLLAHHLVKQDERLVKDALRLW